MAQDKGDEKTFTGNSSKSELGVLITNSFRFVTDQLCEELWNDVQNQSGTVVISNDDAVNRPKFVGLQAFIEANLATALKQDKITAAVGVIHTKLPPTPLRTDGIITEGLVAEEIMQDKNRLETVLKRPNIIRSFLNAGGRLVAVYPEASLQEQIPGIEIFNNLLPSYKNLVNFPITKFSDEYTGATYLMKEKNGEISCFSIKATQASSPDIKGEMGLWFGSLSQAKIQDRFNFINEFLQSQNLDIMAELGRSEENMKVKPGKSFSSSMVL